MHLVDLSVKKKRLHGKQVKKTENPLRKNYNESNNSILAAATYDQNANFAREHS